MSMAQVYALRDHLNGAEQKSIARSEREKDVKEILWCEECMREIADKDVIFHHDGKHVLDVEYKCLSCGEIYLTKDEAFNCCAEDWIKR